MYFLKSRNPLKSGALIQTHVEDRIEERSFLCRNPLKSGALIQT